MISEFVKASKQGFPSETIESSQCHFVDFAYLDMKRVTDRNYFEGHMRVHHRYIYLIALALLSLCGCSKDTSTTEEEDTASVEETETVAAEGGETVNGEEDCFYLHELSDEEFREILDIGFDKLFGELGENTEDADLEVTADDCVTMAQLEQMSGTQLIDFVAPESHRRFPDEESEAE